MNETHQSPEGLQAAGQAPEAGHAREPLPGGQREEGGKTAGSESAAPREVANPFVLLGLDHRLAGKLAEAGIAEPTEVQAQAWPELLSGRDGILRSPTGSGKTLAYLLPLLQRLDPAKRETQAVILAPTQELAMQIVRVAETYGEPLGIRTVALIGGAALSRQLERMKSKPPLVVGTPGRVREVALRKKLPLHAVRIVVVDETDRIFSLGGRADVEAILKGAAADRQTVFVSATRSEAMREAETRWLRQPFEADTATEGKASGLPETIEHWYFVCDRRDKIDVVRRLVRALHPSSTLVFVNDTDKIGELVAKLRYEGFAADALYGDTSGRDRGEALRRFREGRTKLLVATDVAARGLDIPGLSLVVQFEPALDADHYVHRAGRTGRMGRPGISATLVTPQEKFITAKLGKKLGIAFAEKALREGRVIDAAEARRHRAEAGDGQSSPGRKPAPSAGSGRQAGAPEGGSSGARGPGGAGTAAPGRIAAPGPAAVRAPGSAGTHAPGSARMHAPGSAGTYVPGRAADAPGRAGSHAHEMHAHETHAQGRTANAPGRTAKNKADRKKKKKDKDKGAPRWLKEKRQAQPSGPAE